MHTDKTKPIIKSWLSFVFSICVYLCSSVDNSLTFPRPCFAPLRKTELKFMNDEFLANYQAARAVCQTLQIVGYYLVFSDADRCDDRASQSISLALHG